MSESASLVLKSILICTARTSPTSQARICYNKEDPSGFALRMTNERHSEALAEESKTS